MRIANCTRLLGLAIVATIATACGDSTRSPLQPSTDLGNPSPVAPSTPASVDTADPTPDPPPSTPAPGNPEPTTPGSEEPADDDNNNNGDNDNGGSDDPQPPSNPAPPSNPPSNNPPSNPPPMDEEQPPIEGPPTNPGPPAEPPSTPTAVGIDFVIDEPNSSVEVEWNAVPNATSYVVQLGTSPGANDLGTFNVDGLSYTSDSLPMGTVHARVQAKNGSVAGEWSDDVSVYYFDFRDYIEAIFLGTGPLSPTDGNHGCSATGWVRGFPAGSNVPMIVSTTVSSGKAAAIEAVTNQVDDATRGVLRASYEETDDPNPIPSSGEATSTTHPDASEAGCPSDNGCTIHIFESNASPGRYVSSRAVQPSGQTPNAYAHDAVGHGIIGLCHVDGNRIGGAQLSLMSAGPGVFSGDIASRLTNYDLMAARALYGAGLRAGKRRQDLVAAGLIAP